MFHHMIRLCGTGSKLTKLPKVLLQQDFQSEKWVRENILAFWVIFLMCWRWWFSLSSVGSQTWVIQLKVLGIFNCCKTSVKGRTQIQTQHSGAVIIWNFQLTGWFWCQCTTLQKCETNADGFKSLLKHSSSTECVCWFHFSDKYLSELCTILALTICLAHLVLGQDTFYKWDGLLSDKKKVKVHNLDCWFFCFQKLSEYVTLVQLIGCHPDVLDAKWIASELNYTKGCSYHHRGLWMSQSSNIQTLASTLDMTRYLLIMFLPLGLRWDHHLSHSFIPLKLSKIQ